MKAEIKLGPIEVEDIIREHMERKLGTSVDSVLFDISQGYNDRGDYSLPTLREVIIHVHLDEKIFRDERRDEPRDVASLMEPSWG